MKVVRETSTGHRFAAKITCVVEETIGKMAIKEFQTLMKIEHANVIRPSHFLIDVPANKAYMFMPILNKSTLSDELANRHRPFSEPEVQSIARQLMNALQCIHAMNVVHRDVNPNNVMYDEGRITLIDFQTCTELKPGKWMMSIVGTGDYKAPEMKTSNTYKYDTHSELVDVWSAGAVLATLLHQDPTDFSTEVPELSAACVDFFRKTLETDPRQRISAKDAEAHEWLA